VALAGFGRNRPGQGVSAQALQSKPFVGRAPWVSYRPGLPLDTHLEVCRQGATRHVRSSVSEGGEEAVGMLGNVVPSHGMWRKVSARLAGSAQVIRRVRPIGLDAAPRMVRMTTTVVTTRHARAHAGCSLRSTVTTDVDQNVSVAPATALQQGGGRGHGPADLVMGVRSASRTPLRRRDGDVIRVPALSRSKSEPRRGVSSHGLLVLRRAVRAAQTHVIPVRTSWVEGAGMT
jgi:hypothetical protein